ncbi:unnamed protein product, partial [Didymodactylos carnosus]
PIQDPLAILLIIDYYALRSEEYDFLLKFYNEQNNRLNLDGLPNFAYSISLALYHQSKQTKDQSQANLKLQEALLRFPSTFKYLLDKMSIQPDRNVEKNKYFSQSYYSETDALKCVQTLYAIRCSNEWKISDVIEFLRQNVNETIRIIEQNDSTTKEYLKKRETNYRKTPVNICRHIVLSESNEIRGFLPTDLQNGQTFYSFDPFPPKDSTSCYQRPER